MKRKLAIEVALLVGIAALAGGGSAASGSTPKVGELQVTAQIPIGRLAGGIVGARGFLWVVSVFPKNEVDKIDPKTNRVVARLPLGGVPSAEVAWITYGAGSLWISRATAWEVDRVSLNPLSVVSRTKIQDPFDVAVGFGSVWVPQFDPYQWSRIGASTNKVSKTAPATGPTAAVVDHGFVWILEHRSRSILKISPATGTVVKTIPVVTGGSVPERLAAGFGSLWTTDPQSSSIARIDEASGRQRVEIVLPKEPLWNPYPIATGGGSVWVGTDHGVGRIDPVTNQLTGELKLAYANPTCGPSTQSTCINGITYANGSVWATDWAGKQVVRIAPH
jgi:streptogramin lyase